MCPCFKEKPADSSGPSKQKATAEAFGMNLRAVGPVSLVNGRAYNPPHTHTHTHTHTQRQRHTHTHGDTETEIYACTQTHNGNTRIPVAQHILVSVHHYCCGCRPCGVRLGCGSTTRQPSGMWPCVASACDGHAVKPVEVTVWGAPCQVQLRTLMAPGHARVAREMHISWEHPCCPSDPAHRLSVPAGLRSPCGRVSGSWSLRPFHRAVTQ